MTNNVTAIFGGTTGARTSNEHCIRELRRVLEMAESGEVVGCFIAAAHFDGQASGYIGGRVGKPSMIGIIEIGKAGLISLLPQEIGV